MRFLLLIVEGILWSFRMMLGIFIGDKLKAPVFRSIDELELAFSTKRLRTGAVFLVNDGVQVNEVRNLAKRYHIELYRIGHGLVDLTATCDEYAHKFQVVS